MMVISKKNSTMCIVAIALLASQTANAQSIPDGLDKVLTKKYSPRVLVLEELITTKEFPNGKPVRLGPYIAKDYFNYYNASPLGRPAKRVKKYCEKVQKSSFKQIETLQPSYKLSSDHISIKSDGKDISVSSDEIFKIVRATWPLLRNGKTSYFGGKYNTWSKAAEAKYLKLSREEKLGVFSCVDETDLALWTVAILPDQFIQVEEDPLLKNTSIFKKQISIVPLDKATIENHRLSMLSIEKVHKERELEIQKFITDKAVSVSNFRATIDVGSETNCGLVIQKRNGLLEVDLKARYAKSTGKSTAWMKTDDLHPDDTGTICAVK